MCWFVGTTENGGFILDTGYIYRIFDELYNYHKSQDFPRKD